MKTVNKIVIDNKHSVVNYGESLCFLEIINPKFRIRLRCKTKLFNNSRSSRTIFKEGIQLYFEFKNGSKFLVLKKNLAAVNF